MLLALVVAGLLSVGCKGRDPEATGRKVTAESKYDATEPIEDEGFRFALAHPGSGWKLLRKQDIRRMVPDAVAGATNGDGVFGSVIVERLPGIDLDTAVSIVTAQMTQAVTVSEDKFTFNGVAAHRGTYNVTLEGNEFRYQRISFLRGDYLYQLLAWGALAKTNDLHFAPFFSAFSLTEGEIEGQADDRPPVMQADGVTWQIRDGRFGSAVSGLRLTVPPSWRYLVGQELVQTNAEAELALANAQQGSYIAVISERQQGTDGLKLVEALHQGLAERIGPAAPGPTLTVAGEPLEFTRYSSDTTLEFLAGIYVRNGALTQILTWYPAPMREAAQADFATVLERMSLMTETERQQLGEQLAAREGVQWKVAKHSAFLGDEYRDFTHRLRWSQPKGLFTVWVGDEARAQAENSVLSLQAPLQSVYANLEVVAGQGSMTSQLHEKIASTLHDRRNDVVPLDSLMANRSFGTDTMAGVKFYYGLISAEHEGNAVVLTVWGPAAASGIEAAVDAILDGLSFPVVLPDTTLEDGRLTDHHHGVSVVGPTGWTHNDDKPAGMPFGRFLEWKKGRAELALLCVAAPGMSDDESWLASFTEQSMRDLLADRMTLGEPQSSAATLDGHPSRQLSYDDAQIEVVVRNSVLYMFIAAHVDASTRNAFRDSVRWHR